MRGHCCCCCLVYCTAGVHESSALVVVGSSVGHKALQPCHYGLWPVHMRDRTGQDVFLGCMMLQEADAAEHALLRHSSAAHPLLLLLLLLVAKRRWEPLLSMVCTSLASLLKSPVMAGLAELAGCLVDTREEFSTLAKAFIQVGF